MDKASDFHILVVDDEKLNIELAAIYLQEVGYKVSFALNAKAAIESVMKLPIDLILLDINMPQKDGFEVCKLLKNDKKSKDIPVVFLTAQTDIDYISKAFEVGGIDYISKPFNSIELKARVKTHLQTVSNLNEIKEKQSKLAQLSITDPLTKLHNALYLDTQIKSYANRKEAFWLVYIKIDRFDKINQIYGFNGGDKIIKSFANLLSDVSYSNAIVVRLYGTSFGVLMKDYDIQEIKNFYEKLFKKHMKDKKSSNIFSFSTLFYNVKDPTLPINSIYKKVQESMQRVENSDDKFLFIS